MFSWIRRFNSTADRWLFENRYTTQAGLGIFRILFALYFLLVLTPNHHRSFTFWRYGNIPDSLFAPPPGPMTLFSGVPGPFAFHALTLVLTVALVLLLVGLFTRPASLTIGLTLLTMQGFENSFGKINHDFLFIVLPFVMSFSGWGKHYSVHSLRRAGDDASVSGEDSGGWPPVIMALVLGIMMATAALAKVAGGWLSPATHGLQFYITVFDTDGSGGVLTGPLASLPKNILWEPFDWLVIGFEGALLLSIFNIRLFRIFLAFTAVFHLVVLLTLGISFATALIIYALFIPWERLTPFSRWSGVLEMRLRDWAPVLSRAYLVVPAAAGVGVLLYFAGSPVLLIERIPESERLLRSAAPIDTVSLVVGGIVGAAVLIRTGMDQTRSLGRIVLSGTGVRRRAHA